MLNLILGKLSPHTRRLLGLLPVVGMFLLLGYLAAPIVRVFFAGSPTSAQAR